MAQAATRPLTSTGTFGRGINSLLAAVRGYFEARATRLALSKLTDHELDDIGLTRSDLNSL